jgi:hypothetical protein
MISMMAMLSCKNEVTITPTEEAQNELVDALQGTWTAVEVRKDNTVITDFSNFRLTISEKSYSTENGAPVWPGNGSFDFATAETENEFLRQDGRLFTAAITNGVLSVTIIYNEEAGRGEFGTYDFVME